MIKQNYVEILFVKGIKGTGIQMKKISPSGQLLDVQYVEITKEKILEAWESVESDGIPFCLIGMFV